MSHPIITAGEPVLRCQTTLGEGPLWDADKQLLHFLDIEKGEIHTFDPPSNEHTKVAHPGKRIGSLALRSSHPGSFICGVEHDICFTSPSAPGSLTPISPAPEVGPHAERFNDGVVDPRGRFITGTMGNQKGGGALYSISPSPPHTPTLLIPSGISCSNGTGWSPSGTTMYYVDSGPKANIWAYDYDLDSGSISNKRVFAKDTFGDEGTFDGLCMDAKGAVWVARWKSSRVVKYEPDGSIGLEIRFPKAQNITCTIFGGKDLTDLYVTTASCHASDEPDLVGQFPEGGDLYRISFEDGTKGVEKFKFGG